MKTPEDEAFDELASKQGDWGSGFQAKRAAAMDKINSDFDEEYKKSHAELAKYRTEAQPAQEPDALTIAYQSGFYDGKKAAQPAQEPAFKWRSVFQEMPAENSHILFCFGVHIVEGSFTKNGWASLAYGTAQPDFWAYFPPPPHHKRNQELYAMPPKREWVGLTPEETSGFTQHEMTVVKYVSKVLQEKNT